MSQLNDWAYYGPFWPVMALTIATVLLGMLAFIGVLFYRDARRTRHINRLSNQTPDTYATPVPGRHARPADRI